MKDWAEVFNSLTLEEKKRQFQNLLEEMQSLGRTETWVIGFVSSEKCQLRVIDWGSDDCPAHLESIGPGMWVEIDDLKSWIDNIKTQ